MIKLSIVIPYYEVYDLAIQLLKSLSIQVNDKVEVILVDDYCKKEFHNMKDELALNNIKLIEHNINEGVSKSRNDGIKKAKGKYIAFCDVDDLIMIDYVDRLLELIDTHNEDVMIFNWLDINTNEVNRRPQNCAVWKAIYKKEIIPKFNEELRVREDYYWQKDLEQRIPSVYYYDRVLYIYNSGREGSLWWNETHK